jgi:lysine N6-hydroxylase
VSKLGHYLCVGIGVGPANLSLASLLHGNPRAKNLFIDKKSTFEWHDGQLIHGTALQVSMLKDLVSLADPTSEFSFLAYLCEQGRIYHFLNAQFDAVPRQEFRNYMEWACRKNENVVFGEEALGVTFDRVFRIETTRQSITADNIVIGTGTQPWVPPQVRDLLGKTQFHVHDFLGKSQHLGGRRVCIVGGGQSGAEAFLDLVSRPPAERPAHVAWVSRRANYLPLDDSPFTNDFFVPSYSDYFYRLTLAVREEFNEQHILTSDGISTSTLREIYQAAYRLRFLEDAEDPYSFLPDRDISAISGSDDAGWSIDLTHNHDPRASEDIRADTVIWASGFRPVPMDFLDPIAHRLVREDKEYRIDEDFAVRWDGPQDHSIFIQNGARQQRGHADANLSLNAWRSQRIANRLLGMKGPEPLASFLSWGPDSGR